MEYTGPREVTSDRASFTGHRGPKMIHSHSTQMSLFMSPSPGRSHWKEHLVFHCIPERIVRIVYQRPDVSSEAVLTSESHTGSG